MGKVGGWGLQELSGKCIMCSCFRDVVIHQMIGLHCIGSQRTTAPVTFSCLVGTKNRDIGR